MSFIGRTVHKSYTGCCRYHARMNVAVTLVTELVLDNIPVCIVYRDTKVS